MLVETDLEKNKMVKGRDFKFGEFKILKLMSIWLLNWMNECC